MPIPEFSYGGVPQNYFEPGAPPTGPLNYYNNYMAANQQLASYQGIDNIGYELNGQYDHFPAGSMGESSIGKDSSVDWNPINLSKLYPKLYLSPSGSYSDTPYKNSRFQFPKAAAKLTADKVEDLLTSDSFPLQSFIRSRTSNTPKVTKDVWKNLLKCIANHRDDKCNRSDSYIDMDKPPIRREKVMNCINGKLNDGREGMKMEQDASNTNNTMVTLLGVNGGTEHIPLPEKLVRKKSAQMKALQNLSKLKAMIHIAKEERRSVQHKREEARRQFLSEVAEELQLMSSAKLAEIEASKSYRALSAAEMALSEKDKDIHMLLEKEDMLYEDLTDAEASLAKADMTFIPKIKSENELRQFASFLNFGF